MIHKISEDMLSFAKEHGFLNITGDRNYVHVVDSELFVNLQGNYNRFSFSNCKIHFDIKGDHNQFKCFSCLFDVGVTGAYNSFIKGNPNEINFMFNYGIGNRIKESRLMMQETVVGTYLKNIEPKSEEDYFIDRTYNRFMSPYRPPFNHTPESLKQLEQLGPGRELFNIRDVLLGPREHFEDLRNLNQHGRIIVNEFERLRLLPPQGSIQHTLTRNSEHDSLISRQVADNDHDSEPNIFEVQSLISQGLSQHIQENSDNEERRDQRELPENQSESQM